MALDNGRKYHSNARSYYTEVRAKSDALCRQYGLSVIETPESNQITDNDGGMPTWQPFRRDYTAQQLEKRFALEEERAAQGLPNKGRAFYAVQADNNGDTVLEAQGWPDAE